MKWLAIINPLADRHTSAQLQALEHELAEDLGADCVWTATPGEARRLAHDSNGYDGYIAVGGDGTISEIINSFAGKVPRLAFIPTGTGNGLARDLALRNERRAIGVLSRPRFKSLDLISVRVHRRGGWQRRFLISTSGLGYPAGTTELALGPFKWFKRVRFAVAAFVQAWRQTEFRARFRLDDGPWQERILTNLAVHNTQHAGQFLLFPDARLDDGKLDVLLGRQRILGQLLEDLSIVTRTFFVAATRMQARKLDVELQRPAPLMFDGDLIYDVDAVQYQVLPGRLCCCVGAEQTFQETPPEGSP